MSTQKIRGKFFHAFKTESKQKDGKTYHNRAFFINTSDNPEKTNTPQFNLSGDKCTLVDGLKPGDEIEVYFEIIGRPYINANTGKKSVFTALQCWRIDEVYAAPEIKEIAAPAQYKNDLDDPATDDLPFQP